MSEQNSKTASNGNGIVEAVLPGETVTASRARLAQGPSQGAGAAVAILGACLHRGGGLR